MVSIQSSPPLFAPTLVEPSLLPALAVPSAPIVTSAPFLLFAFVPFLLFFFLVLDGTYGWPACSAFTFRANSLYGFPWRSTWCQSQVLTC